MRVLIHVTDLGFLRHFSSVIRSLVRRGHTVRIASPVVGSTNVPSLVPAGLEEIALVRCPEHRGDALGCRIGALRAVRDYLRYLAPPFERASKLRARALKKCLKEITAGERSHLSGRCPGCGTALEDDALARLALGDLGAPIDRLLALVEQATPSDPGIESFLRDERPDVLLVTPLVRIGSAQSDYVKSARALGVPVIFPVFSWDNLSTKGRIHEIPDAVLVWNECQRAEAIELHQVPAERVVVVGAPRFDHFFAMKPKVGRERFCRKRGLDPARPIVTYLCSSNFVAGRERAFVQRWIDHVRRAPALESCSLVIRPHPRQKAQWRKFRRAPGVVLSWPRSITGDQPLFDALYHSAAVVGLNTSAELEAGVVGRPVLTLLAPEFAGGQEQTVHFRYLLKESGGFVEMAPDMETHLRQLERAVAGEYDPDEIRAAVARFLRPRGSERRATAIMVEAIEAIGRRRRRAVDAGWLGETLWRGVRRRFGPLRGRAAES